MSDLDGHLTTGNDAALNTACATTGCFGHLAAGLGSAGDDRAASQPVPDLYRPGCNDECRRTFRPEQDTPAWRGSGWGSRGQQGLTLVELMISLPLWVGADRRRAVPADAPEPAVDAQCRLRVPRQRGPIGPGYVPVTCLRRRVSCWPACTSAAPTSCATTRTRRRRTRCGSGDGPKGGVGLRRQLRRPHLGGGHGLNMSLSAHGRPLMSWPLSACWRHDADVDAVTPAIAAVTAFGRALPMTSGESPSPAARPWPWATWACLRVPVNGGKTCFRVPFTTLTTSAGVDRFTAGGTLTPSTFFTGYSGRLATFASAGRCRMPCC